VKLEKMQLGQFVGGRTKTEVLRPEMSLKEEEIPVFTGTILADISPAPIPELDASEHADLKVDAKKLKQLGTVDKALLVDRFGQLVALDPKATDDDQKGSQKAVDDERKKWKHLKERADALAVGRPSDLERLTGGGKSSPSSISNSSDMMYQMMGSNQQNPLKKTPGGKPKKPSRGGNSSSSSSSGYGSGM
jgi:hypothetical protein